MAAVHGKSPLNGKFCVCIILFRLMYFPYDVFHFPVIGQYLRVDRIKIPYDHIRDDIHLLFPCLQKGTYAEIVDSQNRLYLIDGEHTFRKGETWGKYISFLPLTEEVKGITLRGFKYPLTDRDISIGTSLRISNELVEEEGTITFSDGVLITVESHD